MANEAVRPLRLDDIDNEDRLRMADTSPSVINATHKFASSIRLLKDIIRGSANQNPEVITMTERVRIAAEEPMPTTMETWSPSSSLKLRRSMKS